MFFVFLILSETACAVNMDTQGANSGVRVSEWIPSGGYIYALLFICLFPDMRRGKDISKDEQRREINPDCANASNPYHTCGDHCKRKG